MLRRLTHCKAKLKSENQPDAESQTDFYFFPTFLLKFNHRNVRVKEQ
jgi:hypothetical protein